MSADAIEATLSDSAPITGDVAARPRFGRFAVLDQLGAGAMGVVYAAYDPTLDRRVALKVLRGAANRGRGRERTRREALAMARVSHPNVVSVYEVGEADGRLFIAMEYVDGVTLGEWMQAPGRRWPAVVDLFGAIARGLAAAHAEGLIHRDFKPANVLVDQRGRPVIIDFGLARLAADHPPGLDPEPAPDPPPEAETSLEGLSGLTRTGHLLGTPAYLAPEVLAGAPHSPASDQFAFCVSLFEALCGAPPHPRDSLGAMHHAMATGDITTPSGVDVPPGLLDIVRTGLAPRPADRHADISALAAALAVYDSAAADRARGQRSRLAVAATGVLAIGGAAAFQFVYGRPETPGAVLWTAGVIAALLCILTLALWPVTRHSASGRGVASVILIGLIGKQIALTVTAGLGAGVAVLVALDAAFALTLVALGGHLLALRQPALGIAAGLVAIAAMPFAPEHVVALHGAALGALAVEITVIEIRGAAG